MTANLVGLIVPVFLLAVVIVGGVLYARRLGAKRAASRRSQAAGEAPYETRGHLAMRITLAAVLIAVGIVLSVFLSRN